LAQKHFICFYGAAFFIIIIIDAEIAEDSYHHRGKSINYQQVLSF
jgi:hypothetical protein